MDATMFVFWVAIIAAITFFILWLVSYFRADSQKYEIKLLKSLVSFLDKSTREDVSNFPTELLEGLSPSYIDRYIEKPLERIKTLYWRIFYEKSDKIEVTELFNYTFVEDSEIKNLGFFIDSLRGALVTSTRQTLIELFTEATLKAQPNNLACTVIYVICAKTEEKINPISDEVAAKDFILEILSECDRPSYVNLFLEGLNKASKELLTGHTFNKDHKVEFEYEIIQINKLLKQKK